MTACGNYDDLVEVADWMVKHKSDEKHKPHVTDTSFFLFKPSGETFWLTTPYLRPIPIKEAFFAYGSGGAHAMGAMAAGAGAKKACEIACRYDTSSGGGVDVVRVVPLAKKSKI